MPVSTTVLAQVRRFGELTDGQRAPGEADNLLDPDSILDQQAMLEGKFANGDRALLTIGELDALDPCKDVPSPIWRLMDNEQQQLFLLRRKVARAARDREKGGATAEQQQPLERVHLTAVREAVLAAQEEVMAECDGLEGFDFEESEQDLEDLQDAEGTED